MRIRDRNSDVCASDLCRRLVAELGHAGWLRFAVPQGPQGSWGGCWPQIDSRAVCILRETLARHDGLADFAFAMQGLGSGAISLAGRQAIRPRYPPQVAAGPTIGASTAAPRVGQGWVRTGRSRWLPDT